MISPLKVSGVIMPMVKVSAAASASPQPAPRAATRPKRPAWLIVSNEIAKPAPTPLISQGFDTRNRLLRWMRAGQCADVYRLAGHSVRYTSWLGQAQAIHRWKSMRLDIPANKEAPLSRLSAKKEARRKQQPCRDPSQRKNRTSAPATAA